MYQMDRMTIGFEFQFRIRSLVDFGFTDFCMRKVNTGKTLGTNTTYAHTPVGLMLVAFMCAA